MFFPFNIFGILFSVMFVFVLTVIIVTTIKNIRTWNRNNHSPRLTVPVLVVSKRTEVYHNANSGDMTGAHGYHTGTTYYVTFQVDSGDRMELCLSGREYGMIAEGDRGELTFQGTRYLSFVRKSL